MKTDVLTPTLLRPGMEPAGFAAAATLVTVEAQERPVCVIHGGALPAGAAVELGYFSDSTIHALFAGTWIPLIGADAPAKNRSIAPIAAGGHGERPGRFTWCRTFFPGIDALPPVGRPLALRILDHPNTTEAFFYNTASHPAWWFREPRTPSPAFVCISLDDPGVRWESGPQGEFRTTLRLRRSPAGASSWRRALARWSGAGDLVGQAGR